MKIELSLKQIKALMEHGLEPSPCFIEPRDPQPPSPEEEREFASVEELWRLNLERLSDE